MSHSVLPAVPSSSKTNNTEESKEPSESEASTSADCKSKLTCTAGELKDAVEATSDVFLRGSFGDENFRAIPSSSATKSLDQIQRTKSQPRRNPLHSFMKTSSLEKHPRRRNSNKIEQFRNNSCATYKSEDNVEASIRKIRSQLPKDKRVFHTFDIGKFGRRLRCHLRETPLKEILDSTFYQRLSGIETIRFIHGGNIRPADILVARPSRVWQSQIDDADSKKIVERSNVARDIATLFEKLSLGHEDNNQGSSVLDKDEGASGCERSVSSWPRLEFADDFQCKMDFSCGDDSRNAEERVRSVDPQTSESKARSVQWNNEVDVIYYAGDADGGKVIRRGREPLHEEAEQQARNKFIQLVLNKNLISSMSGY